MAKTNQQILARVDRLWTLLGDVARVLHEDRDRRLGTIAREAAQIDAEARAVVQDLVTRARRQGASWGDVGAAFGISKQGAQQRFGGER